MKKYLILGLLGLCLFLLPKDVFAKNVGLNYDAHDQFNYYYEQKNNTDFYKFLRTQGDDLPRYLDSILSNSYYNSSGEYRSSYVFIFYASTISKYKRPEVSIPSGTKYVIFLKGNVDNLLIEKNGDTYSFKNKFNSDLREFSYGPNYVYYFNNAGECIGSNLGSHYLPFEANYSFSNTSNEDTSQFTYFLSNYYMGTREINFYDSSAKLVLTDVILDGQHYLIDENSNYSSILSFFRKLFSFGSLEYYSTNYTDIEYYKQNVVISESQGLLSVSNVISYNETNSIPSYYTKVNVTDYSKGFFLIPQKTTKINSRFYLYSKSTNSILYVSAYDIQNNEVKNFDGGIYNTMLEYNTATNCVDCDHLVWSSFDYFFRDTESNIIPYKYMYYISSNNLKSDIYLYYDSESFQLKPFSSTNLTFTNVNTGEITTFTPSQQQSYTEVSKGIADSQKTDLGKGGFFDGLFNGSDSGISSLGNKLSGFVSTLSNSIGVVTGMVSMLFVGFPTDVQNVFLFMLFAGLLIVLIKLII